MSLSPSTSSTSTLTTLHLAHTAPTVHVHIALYRDVQNAPFLRQQLLDGNADFEYALVDAEMIISTTHILAAVFRACTDAAASRLKSRNVHSEIVFALGMNNNIADAFRTFGIQPTTTSLLIIKVTSTPHSIQTHLATHVHGIPLPFLDGEIANHTDWARVRRAYRLGGDGGGGGGSDGGKRGGGKRERKKGERRRGEGGETRVVEGEQEGNRQEGEREEMAMGKAERHELEMCVLGAIALKGAT